MKDLIAYLNEIKTKEGIKSNLSLAARLGVSAAGIDGLMKGRITPGDELCERIAELSGEKPEIIITLAHLNKAKDAQKKYWKQILKAVTAATFLALFTLPSFAHASTNSIYHNCILCQISDENPIYVTAV